MKKIFLLSFLGFLLQVISFFPVFSQNKGESSGEQSIQPYLCEEDWIEVMFTSDSKVRMRNGNLVDLSTDALQGTDQVLNELAWHKWIRNTDLPEAVIDSWEINGERNTGQDLYNLNNIYRLQIPKGLDVWEVSKRLEALSGIYMARPVPKPMPLPSPPPGSFQSQQGYLNPVTTGVDALWAWTQTGGTGIGVTICDLEYNWNYNHMDVTKAIGSQINPNPLTDPGPGNNNIYHGTAVIGELVANNNGWGTTGICYGSNLKTCGTVYAAGGGWNVPGALAYAISSLSAGDIILLEQQWDYGGAGAGQYIPIEWWLSYSYSFPNQLNNGVYAAIVTAVANGIHVIEAGGNGNYDTGSLNWYGNSGAIIVGAGGTVNTSTNLKRIVPGTWGSSYGPRFNLQGWGENVVTTGGSGAGPDLYSAEGPNYYYTSTFAGTSSASPIVAGALACAEGYYLANISSSPPTPSYMRTHLVTWGTAQVYGPAGNIGPRPNIKAAIQNFPTLTYDYGDAPSPYPTLLATNGARHVNTGLRMGNLIDSESDGQPTVLSDGDDINPPISDDEDGVVFTSALIPGQMATLQITVSAGGILNAWIDFNNVNVWSDPGEFIFQNFSLLPGPNLLSFMVPSSALSGFTYARFRFSTTGGILFYGTAPNGEVEDYRVFIEEHEEFDWGDAPDGPYPTLSANSGANHLIDGLTYLGTLIDAEPDGQPEPLAMGDDLDIYYPPINDDEDGVVFLNPIRQNQTANINVTASVQGFLNVWIDFNINGSWNDPGEQVFTDLIILSGINPLSFPVPGNAITGLSFARFRFCTVQGIGVTGMAPNGEVEDYSITIEHQPEEYDWGDAPDGPYPTLSANNGANHKIVQGFFMGASVDSEPDGQPDPTANGDDNNPPLPNPDDEDGVWWPFNFVPGHGNTIRVTVSAPGYLNAWIDFDQNGSWAEVNEQIFTDQPLILGINDLSMPAVPGNAQLGMTFARFRFSTQQGLSYTGQAPDGEVEDYHITIQPAEDMDYGDAPDLNYQTLAANNGARHDNLGPLVFMGNSRDLEIDGQPTVNASGDDFNPIGALDDEDGVVFITPMIPGQVATITITVNVLGAFQQGWTDFNADGDFTDFGEQIIANINPPALVSPYNFNIPAGATLGKTYARFRYATMLNIPSFGPIPNGEVEDYLIVIGEYDFGDAPDPSYPTLLISNGAYHKVTPLFMGVRIDAEPDGQPDGSATGDDNNPIGLDDEDGVWWGCNFVPGQANTVKVTTTGAGVLNAWFDYNINGDWSDFGEQIFTNVALNAGTTDLTVNVPQNASIGTTFMRYRFNSTGGLTFTGYAPDGEVEDYMVFVQEAEEMDYGDAPDANYQTLAVNNGARHANDPAAPYYLGNIIDWEIDGQPNPAATGDDNNPAGALDDEDGVVLNTPLIPGQQAQVTVTVTLPQAALQGWIDFNADGDWDLGEQIISNFVPVNNVSVINFNVPATAVLSNTYARFRYSTMGNLAPYGCAPNGEVEDYLWSIGEQLDFGDASDPTYPTLLTSNGARHKIVPNIYLGNQVDSENDGQPDPTALGDDNSGLDDEDGVTFDWPLIKGNPAKITVVASTGGVISAWFDFNGNGSWAEAGEQVFADLPIQAGSNTLNFIVPANASAGWTFARFRFSTQTGLSYTGLANNGEVEDYYVNIIEDPDKKWNQPPETGLPGLHSHDYINALGNHETLVLADDWLCNGGQVTDIHWWGNYELDALQQEMRGAGISYFHLSIHSDDPSGLCLPVNPEIWSATVLFSSITEQFTGLYNNEGCKIYLYEYTLPTPFDQISGTRYWLDITAMSVVPANNPHWRWQEAQRSQYPILCGAANEIVPLPGTWSTIVWNNFTPPRFSDMAFIITSVENEELDYGDAPNPWPTLLVNNGARHAVEAGFHLGAAVDTEIDGQPQGFALGDDRNGIDDEDGIAFKTALVPGQPAVVEITLADPTGVGGFLDCWIDFNINGVFEHPAEHLCGGASCALAAGLNTINFNVPAGALIGPVTFARFRLSRAGGLLPTGLAPDGEVEDYRVFIVNPGESKMHWAQLPDQTPTGVDVDMYWVPLADDFLCTETGPINEIEMWGSFAGDGLPAAGVGSLTFKITIYSDNPAGTVQPWSMPKDTLWTDTIYPGEYTAQLDFQGPEWWYDPDSYSWQAGNHNLAFRYNFFFDDPFIQQLDSIYWLEIIDLPRPPCNKDYTFGWKTSRIDLRWNDDACVNIKFPIAGSPWIIGWNDLRYPPTHQWQHSSLDLAFLIKRASNIDFGDAPDPNYPTLLANNGPSHIIGPLFLGNQIDGEMDGQQHPNALGDDNNNLDDEDGVIFMGGIFPGQTSYIKVIASQGNGRLQGWIDYNADGDFSDTGEQIFTNFPLPIGSNMLTFTADPNANLGKTFARFRISTTMNLGYTGPAPDGEVEDYEVTISNPVAIWHLDENAGTIAYDATSYNNDGTIYGPTWTPGYSNSALSFNGNNDYVDVQNSPSLDITGPFSIQAWIKCNGAQYYYAIVDKYEYTAAGSKGFTLYLTGGQLRLSVYSGAAGNGDVFGTSDLRDNVFHHVLGSWDGSYMRVYVDGVLEGKLPWTSAPVSAVQNVGIGMRLSGWGSFMPFSGIIDEVVISASAPPEMDYGDAPDPNYPTLFVNNGARHILVGGTYLGLGVDYDPDGQPDPNALGDDNDGNDDEDGVVLSPFTPIWTPGGSVWLDITASTAGYLNAWVDFDANGYWGDPGEQIFIDQPLTAGTNSFIIGVPVNAQVGKTFARYRFSSVAGLSYTGLAPDGEVEDYQITIEGDVEVGLKVFLEGPYAGTTMTTTLNNLGYLPLVQPYNSDPTAVWYYTGTESVPSIPNANVTDWVLVEFRDAPSAAAATRATMTSMQPAFVLKDGSVVALDGTSLVKVNGVFQYNPFVVIWHRNHLGVISATPLAWSGINQYSYDFTSGAGQAYLYGQKNLGGGIYGMYGADGAPNQLINLADKTAVWAPQVGTKGYKAGDFNMNGHVNNPDKNNVWVPNLGQGTKVP